MRLLLIALLLGGTSGAQQQSLARPELTFHFERPATTQTPYIFRLRDDGTGTYDASVPELPGQPAATVHEVLAVSPATAARLFALARDARFFTKPCASKAKVADTGAKTLSYTGPDGSGSCTFNYTDNKSDAALMEVFLAMEVTLEQGRRLAFFQRYDRLSLAAAMEFLYDSAQAGRATEMGNIAAELRSLADDTEVLEKVRSRAATLLGTAEQSGAIPKP